MNKESKPVNNNSKRSLKNAGIAKNWMVLQRPANYQVSKTEGNETTFVIEPLETGFGITLGNALRRILLSSLQGVALAWVKIDGVEHEYSSIPGVKEDVLDIVLNLKSIILSGTMVDDRTITLDVKGPCEVTAGMIKTVDDIKIVNPDLVICNLDKNSKVSMQLGVRSGKGYVSTEEHKAEMDKPLFTIVMDSIFSPIKRVSYKIENSRVGSKTGYDRLLLIIETNGSIVAETALGLAAKIMQDQLQVFINFEDTQPEIEEEEKDQLSFDPKLLIKIENLELSVRPQNCLKSENIAYIGDLVVKNEAKMMQTPNFGKKYE